MIPVSYLRMGYIFSKSLYFTTDDLLDFIKNNINKDITPIVLIGNLLEEKYSNNFSYQEIKRYVQYITQQYAKINKTTVAEKQWIQFYLLLGIVRYNPQYSNFIYNEYKNLPKIRTLITEQQIIAQRMLPYYYERQEDYSKLEEIYKNN